MPNSEGLGRVGASPDRKRPKQTHRPCAFLPQASHPATPAGGKNKTNPTKPSSTTWLEKAASRKVALSCLPEDLFLKSCRGAAAIDLLHRPFDTQRFSKRRHLWRVIFASAAGHDDRGGTTFLSLAALPPFSPRKFYPARGMRPSRTSLIFPRFPLSASVVRPRFGALFFWPHRRIWFGRKYAFSS